MMFEITALYVGLNALILALLGLNVVRWRWREKVSMGDGGQKMMARAIRAHANAAEYIPVALLMLAAMEAMGAPDCVAHVFGVLLTLARLSHGYALIGVRRPLFRMIGAGVTFLLYFAGALGLIGHALIG